MPEENGLLPARGGRGAEVNGLFPGRAPPGRGPGEAPGIAVGFVPLVVWGAATFGISKFCVGAASCAVCVGVVAKTSNSLSGVTGATGFFVAAFFAGAGALATAAFNSGNLSCKRRMTGASTVEEADLTYSPTSSSLEIISLLSTPSAFASS